MNEKVCPHCGHAIISWEFGCPGCDQIPSETAAGRRILAGERRQRILKILIALVIAAVFFTALSFVVVKVQYGRVAQVQKHLNAMSGRVLHFQHGLKMSETASEQARQRLREQAVAWLNIEGPMLLQILNDYADYADIRAQVVILIIALFHRESPIRDWAPETHADFVKAVESMEAKARPDSDFRRVLGMVLSSIR